MTARRVIQPAVRRGKKARVAIDGPSGGGKTWTALLTAHELAPTGRILVVDTERGSAALYAGDFDFPYDELAWEPPYDPRELSETLASVTAEYDVVIVDSLSHFWRGEGGTLDIVEASTTRSGNRFAGWKTGTPAQNSMIDALLLAKSHVIVTMRSAQEWVLSQDDKGRQIPKRVGMAPVQRNDLEFEFTVVADLDLEHTITVTKSRCRPLADRRFPAGHGQKFGQILHEWLDSAEAEAEPAPTAAEPAAAATEGANGSAPAAVPNGTDVYALIETAINGLQGADRGKFLGKHQILPLKMQESLRSKPAEKLAAIRAELGIDTVPADDKAEPAAPAAETETTEAVTPTEATAAPPDAKPAEASDMDPRAAAALEKSFEDPKDIPFLMNGTDSTRSVRRAREVNY